MAGVTRGEVYLDYLFKFRCIGRGKMNYMLNVPEFRKRMEELTAASVTVDEQVLHNVLVGIREDALNGKINADDVPLAKIRSMINALERSLSDSADS